MYKPHMFHGLLRHAGHYVTEDISPAYLQALESSVRMQGRKRAGEKIALVV